MDIPPDSAEFGPAGGGTDFDSQIAVAVFARAPVPGQAKTRLIPRLGAEGAADLQRAFILRTVRTAQAAGLGPVSLWCAPDCTHGVFSRCQRDFGITLRPQFGADLGERMFNALAQLCAQGPALLVGTDCPALTPTHLTTAARALHDGNDAVLLPAEDGGYVLLGLRRANFFLFQKMPWGGADVMAKTRERLRRAAWRWQEPARLWDVDEPDDLERLRVSGLMARWFAGKE
jgi:rSAM/selenodomain-associated transferase 1